MSDQHFEDQQGIRALLERYCEGVNQRDADVWGSTWAEDAVWELPHLDMEGLQGRETIVGAWPCAHNGFSTLKTFHIQMRQFPYGILRPGGSPHVGVSLIHALAVSLQQSANALLVLKMLITHRQYSPYCTRD